MQIPRPITPADFATVLRHRAAMFRDSGRPEEVIAALAEPFAAWLAPRLADGRYFGWMIEEAGEAVAGIGMMEIEWPPHPSHPTSDRRGYILNLYVEPEHRRRGLAKTLMDAAMDEARARGLEYVILHATDQGRPLYASLGWSPTAEMAISVPPRS
jgi:ribosomal protein S18 acetylase RimI-like enzyme